MFPSTADITDQALSGRNAIRHTDSCYYIVNSDYQNPGLPWGYVNAVTDFLRHVQRVVERYNTKRSAVLNYEDFYFLISQVRDDERGEYDNFALRPFSELLATQAASVLSRKRGRSDRTWSFGELCDETCNYIRDSVHSMLCQTPRRTDHLRLLVDAHQSHSKQLHIFTLNHDTLIEDFLDTSGLGYTDGFGVPENGVRYWHPSHLEKARLNVFVYKLHGSVNWYLLRPDGGTPYEEHYGIPVDGDYWHTRTPDGRLQTPLDARPAFLIGTFDKTLRYTDEIYIDLHFRFGNVLRNTGYLIVCGYGFRDKAINAQIIRWIYGNIENKLIVIHRDPQALFSNARNAVRREFEHWVEQGKLVTVSRYLEDVRWSDIEAALSQ